MKTKKKIKLRKILGLVPISFSFAFMFVRPRSSYAIVDPPPVPGIEKIYERFDMKDDPIIMEINSDTTHVKINLSLEVRRQNVNDKEIELPSHLKLRKRTGYRVANSSSEKKIEEREAKNLA